MGDWIADLVEGPLKDIIQGVLNDIVADIPTLINHEGTQTLELLKMEMQNKTIRIGDFP